MVINKYTISGAGFYRGKLLNLEYSNTRHDRANGIFIKQALLGK